MKSKLLLFAGVLMLFISINVKAQEAYRGTVTVFAEGGEKFTLYLNGDQKNTTPEARVVAENITEVPVSFRIVFETPGLKEIKKNGLRQGKICVYAIVKNKKGEHSLKVKDCQELFDGPPGPDAAVSTPAVNAPSAPTTMPDQLSATYANGVITINDGRQLTVAKVKVNGMTYPRLIMNAPQTAKATIKYDGNNEEYSAEVPLQYEVKDYANNDAYFTLTVDEGGPKKTWHVKLQNSNGFDLKID